MESARITIEKFCPVCDRRYSPEDSLVMCQDDGTELLPVTNDELAGKVIDGKFRLLEIIGTGGCSTVYRAKHIPLNRTAAFKLLRSDLVSTIERIKRFEQEAQLVSGLNHPNICTVYDCGILATGQPYLVLENVEGKNLSDILMSGRLTPESRALKLIKQIAAGMKAAHHQGVLHRDLKPGNIMILETAEGEQVKIIDFGLAKALDTAGEELTATGHAIGTPAYMSPEQVRGDVLDARSDIYSFGCVIFEMLTGKRAIDGRTAFETMQNHLVSHPGPLTTGNYVVPFVLRELTLKCLQKEPADRYQTMDELEAEIERIAAGVLKPEKAPLVIGESAKKGVLVAASLAIVLAVGALIFKVVQLSVSTPDVEVPTVAAASKQIQPSTQKVLDEFDGLRKTGSLVVAERVMLRAIDGLDKDGKQYSPDMVALRKALASYYINSVRLSDSGAQVPFIFAAEKKLAGSNIDELMQAHMNAAEALMRAEKEDQAIEHYAQYSVLAKERFGENTKQYRDAVNKEAVCEGIRGENDKAEADFKRLLATYKDPKQTDETKVEAYQDLSNLYAKQRKLQEARQTSEQAIANMNNDTNPELRIDVLRAAAAVADLQHDYTGALELIDRAIKESVAFGKTEGFWLTNELLLCKGTYQEEAKQYVQAESTLRQAAEQLGRTHKPESAEYQMAVREYIKVLRALGRGAQADALARTGRL